MAFKVLYDAFSQYMQGQAISPGLTSSNLCAVKDNAIVLEDHSL